MHTPPTRQLFVRSIFGFRFGLAILSASATILSGCSSEDDQKPADDSAETASDPRNDAKPAHPGLAGSTSSQLMKMLGDREAIAVLIQEYRQMTGDLMPELFELTVKPQRTIDPWGNKYRIVEVESEYGFTIISNGPDGEPDTEDDIDLANDIPKPALPQ